MPGLRQVSGYLRSDAIHHQKPDNDFIRFKTFPPSGAAFTL